MTLKEIASVSGKPGLYKVVKPTRTGIILETIDDQKKKLIANTNSRVSLLKEISLYTTSDEGSVLLEEVFQNIKKQKGEVIDVPTSEAEYFSFLKEIVPTYDPERVYVSDVKKLVMWYNTVSKFYPELIEEKKEEKPKAAKKKAPAKKAPAKKKEA